jgi:hypothetical protein
MSDTTAQEAKIPYPTEVGLMSGFVDRVKKQLKKDGKSLFQSQNQGERGGQESQRIGEKLPLIQQRKRSQAKDFKEDLDQIFKDFQSRGSKASQELERLWEVMTVLLPQIKHFIETGD